MGSVNHQLGLATETTYGTVVNPVTKWYQVLDGSGVRLVTEVAMSQGIAPGRRFPLASSVNQVKRRGEGTLNMEVPRTGFGHILQHLLGTTTPTSVQQAATTAYLQTFTAGTTTKSFTLQTGVQRVDTPTTTEPFTAVGCMCPSWTIGVATGEFLTMNTDIIAQDVLDSGNDSETLDTASYSTTTKVFSWENCALTIDAVAVPLANSWSLSGAWNMNTDRYHLGASGLMSQPRNTFGDTLGGSFNADFSALTNWYDRFHDNTTVAMVFTATGDNIATVYDEKLTITLPAVKLRGDGPVISNSLVAVDVPFEVYTPSASEPITITYQSTDTTV